MDFYTKYKRPKKVLEELDKTKHTETAGYRTSQQQIEAILLAGKRLEEFRQGQFDFDVDQPIDDDYIDPTRQPNFDLADASRIAEETNQRLAGQERLNKERLQAGDLEKKKQAEQELKEKLRNEIIAEQKQQKLPLEEV